uniref:Uncharacterized protein n=1 Tax=Oryza sativa subsp. japonica TaxID=39947 RepID=Q9XIZ2_ORYSJ|nr:hypothetical protein [Oryza sativa Japonica Group]BAD67972.1 hypothetical protein [Oryza sativa Japonica Group]
MDRRRRETLRGGRADGGARGRAAARVAAMAERRRLQARRTGRAADGGVAATAERRRLWRRLPALLGEWRRARLGERRWQQRRARLGANVASRRTMPVVPVVRVELKLLPVVRGGDGARRPQWISGRQPPDAAQLSTTPAVPSTGHQLAGHI